MASGKGVSNLGVSGLWQGGKGVSPLRQKVRWCPPHRPGVLWTCAPHLPTAGPSHPLQPACLRAAGLQEAGKYQGSQGRTRGCTRPHPGLTHEIGEGAGVPSFHSSRRAWSFLLGFLNDFWESQMERNEI